MKHVHNIATAIMFVLSVIILAVPFVSRALVKNVADQKACALILTTAGAAHTSGSTTVYLSHSNATTQTSLGGATHYGNGQWCYTLSADNTNYDDIFLLWINTAGVPVHQSYPTRVNVSHVSGTAQTGKDIGAHLDASITTRAAATATTEILAHLNGTLGAGTHSAQTGDSYGYLGTHLVGTIQDGAHLNSTAAASEMDEKHGPGPWTK